MSFSDIFRRDKLRQVITSLSNGSGGSGLLPSGYEMVAGILRFNGSTWELLDDAGHTPVGVSSVSVIGGATNRSIQLTFNKTYSEVLTGGAHGDSEFLKRGVRFAEASMGLNTMDIHSYVDALQDRLTWNNSSAITEVSGFGTIPQSCIATWNNATSEIDITCDPNTIVNIYNFGITFKDENLFSTIRTTSSNRVVFQVRRRDTGALIGDPAVFFGSAANAEANFVTYVNIQKPARVDLLDTNFVNFSNSNVDFYYIAKL